jgi:hypothetical protein
MNTLLRYDSTRRLVYKTLEHNGICFLPSSPQHIIHIAEWLYYSQHLTNTPLRANEILVLRKAIRGKAKSLIGFDTATNRLLGLVVYKPTKIKSLRRFLLSSYQRVPYRKGWRTIQLLGLFAWTHLDIEKLLSFFLQSAAPCVVWILADPSQLPEVLYKYGFNLLYKDSKTALLVCTQE